MIQEFINNVKVSLSQSTARVRNVLRVAFFTGIFAAFVELLFIQALQNFLISAKILPQTVEFESFSGFESLNLSIVLILVLGFFRSALEGFKFYVSRGTMQIFSTALREKILKYSFSSEVIPSTQTVVSIFGDDVARASTALLNFSTILTYFSTGLFMMFFLIHLSPVDFAISLSVVLLLQYPLSFIGRASALVGKKIAEEWESVNQTLTQGLRNSFYLKIYGMVESEKKKAVFILNEYLRRYQEAFRIIAIKLGSPSFIGILTIIVLIVIREKMNVEISSSQFIAFIYLFIRFAQNTSLLLGVMSDFNINIQSAKKVNSWIMQQEFDEKQLLELKNKILSNSIAADFNCRLTSIKVQNLEFSFNQRGLLKDIDFNLEIGDAIVVTGKSGSGKSTLISLLVGMNLTNKNNIFINDVPLNSILKEKSSYQNYLNQIAYIGPYPYLIEGTIKDNLFYGINSHAPDNLEIEDAIRVSCFDRVLCELPQGLDTVLNEQASILSVGQKQRLMIARSLLRNPRLLIMDEATSNLDDETEGKIISGLSNWLSGRMAIIVTHRSGPKRLGNKTLEL